MRSFLGIALFGAVMLVGSAAGAQTPGPFSRDQVNDGRKGFAENCAACHGSDLSGVEAPALTGKIFTDHWGGKNTAEFYKYIQTNMPMCHGGVLGNAAYAELVAFLLWANGAEPGANDFDGKTEVSVSSIASGKLRANLGK